MNDTKFMLLSRSMIGGLATIIGGIGMLVGFDIDVPGLTNTLQDLLTQFGGVWFILSGLFSAIGRWYAKTKLTVTPGGQ